MRIINLDKHEPYQLAQDSKLEVERTNPFFNDYAEHTTPLDLPASDHNRRLLGFPDLFGGRMKMITSDVSIQDGEFHAQCRQAVLSATRKGTIQTSFYLNDGSFYSKIQNVKLKDVFTTGNDVIEFQTVDAAINYCRSLRANNDLRLTIFPVLVDDDSGMDKGNNYKVINAFGKLSSVAIAEWDLAELQSYYLKDIIPFDPDMTGIGCDFYNSTTRMEIVDEIPITNDPGYWISPFIRANYVLRRALNHFGYDLQQNFFETTPPFNKMVFLNNVIDTIVNKKIRLADLVPDVSVSDLLALYRKKFCCEFVPDEVNKTVKIVFLKDILTDRPVADLTSHVTAEPSVSYKTEMEYSRLKLAASSTLDSEAEEDYDDLKDMLASTPSVYFDPATGCFMKDGWSGNYCVPTKVSEASQPYDTGEEQEAKEVKVPECIPEFRTLVFSYTDQDDNAQEISFGKFLYVGKYQTLNSKMVISGEDGQEADDDSGKMKPMLAFTIYYGGRTAGTISPYNVRETTGTKLWDYALYYNGDDGIFERFYRDYDLLLRNSMQQVKIKLLLSQSEKQNLPAWARVTVRGVSFLLNKLKFTLGGKTEPVESELLTTGLYEPVSQAQSITDALPMMSTEYCWVGRISTEEVDVEAYDNSGVDKDRTFKTIYPPVPSADYVGQRYMQQSSYTERQIRHSTFFRSSIHEYTKTTVWLECVHR